MGLVSLCLSGDSETAGKTFKSTQEKKRHCGSLANFKNCMCMCVYVCACREGGGAVKVHEPYN